MPYVTVKMLEGRTEEQKRALVKEVTEAVSRTVNAPAENVTVFIEEMSKTITALQAFVLATNNSKLDRASILTLYPFFEMVIS